MTGRYDAAVREISRRGAIKRERDLMLASWPWFMRSIYFYLATLMVFPLIGALIVWSVLG
jgi:hypothetical protein